ncbi:MAG: hypothetical protein LBV51_04730 [Acholeplasmatales bacterium]|jgi:HAD superfamily phosphatase (TIGR01668 family)|nr:hypothetical protein [Acholeplasmatales bacterium]
MCLYKKFIPSFYKKTIFDIDYDFLKKQGITTLFFDLDNTIIPNNIPYIDEKSYLFLKSLLSDFKILILSNNSDERVKKASKDFLFESLCHKPLIKKTKKALKRVNSTPSCTASIGDQLFTDIFGGCRAKLKYRILVSPIRISSDATRTTLGRKIASHYMRIIKKKQIDIYKERLEQYAQTL